MRDVEIVGTDLNRAICECVALMQANKARDDLMGDPDEYDLDETDDPDCPIHGKTDGGDCPRC